MRIYRDPLILHRARQYCEVRCWKVHTPLMSSQWTDVTPAASLHSEGPLGPRQQCTMVAMQYSRWSKVLRRGACHRPTSAHAINQASSLHPKLRRRSIGDHTRLKHLAVGDSWRLRYYRSSIFFAPTRLLVISSSDSYSSTAVSHDHVSISTETFAAIRFSVCPDWISLCTA